MKIKFWFLINLAFILLMFQYSCEKNRGNVDLSLTGIWEMNLGNGYKGAIFLKQKGKDLFGEFKEYNETKVRYVISGKIKNNKVSLDLSNPESDERVEIEATVAGDKMNGNWIHAGKSESMDAWLSWVPAKK